MATAFMLHAPNIAKIRAKRFRESGTILYLKSIMDSARRVKKLNAISKAGKLNENLLNKAAKIKPESSSTVGYDGEIWLWQKAHFPLSTSHEIIGILCQGLRVFLQLWQCDGVNIMLSSFGSRKITTFKNEPRTTPKIKATANSTILSPQIFSLF